MEVGVCLGCTRNTRVILTAFWFNSAIDSRYVIIYATLDSLIIVSLIVSDVKDPRDGRLSTLMEREAAKKSKLSVFSNLHSEHSMRFDY